VDVAAEDEVLRRSRNVHAAWAESDVETLRSLIASDYHHVDIHGVVFGRDDWLAYAAEPRSPGAVTSEDEAVTVIGTLAILTSTIALANFDDAARVRLTEVWSRTTDGWRRSWYHATTSEPPSRE
jgi:ketosteroid isomerase-like protein